MTKFKDALARMAQDAPPLADIASRALAESRSRPRLRLVPVLGAAAAVATVVGFVAIGLPKLRSESSPGLEARPAIRSASPATLKAPDSAPELPARDVGPLSAVYVYSCKVDKFDVGPKPCSEWRVMTRNGRHFRVPDAATTTDGTTGKPQADGTVVVSPDGERLAYLRANGEFVIRTLSTGKVATAFTWDRRVLQAFVAPQAQWSPDGRTLLAVPKGESEEPCVGGTDGSICTMSPGSRFRSKLVDTTTMRVTDLPDPGSVSELFGLTAGYEPFPFKIGTAGEDLPLIDHNGKRVGVIEGSLLPGQKVDGLLGSISPDGKSFAAITFPSKEYIAPRVLSISLSEAKLEYTHQIPLSWLRWDSPKFLGWLDDDRVLIRVSELIEGQGVAAASASKVDIFDLRTKKLTRYLYSAGNQVEIASVALVR